MDMQQKRAKRISLASLVIGLCIAPVWGLTAIVFDRHYVPYAGLISFAIPLFAAVTGTVLGVIGLIRSLGCAPRAKAGVVLGAIGTALNVLLLCWCVFMLLLIIGTHNFGGPIA